MRNHLFEIETKYQQIFTFSIHDIVHYRFDDDNERLNLKTTFYDSYILNTEKYKELKIVLKQKFIDFKIKTIVTSSGLIFPLNKISGLLFNNRGYNLYAQGCFYPISNETYFQLRDIL